MEKWQAAAGVIRMPFLILTPSSVLLGFAAAWADTGEGSVWLAFAILVAALAAHVSVNAFNEHHDFLSGLDLHTVRTPFSGGSGVLPAHPDLASLALAIAVAALAVTLTVGLYLVALRGVPLLVIGMVGAGLVVAYTPLLTRHALACLIAPGVGFGPVMVVGSAHALTGSITATALLLSLVPLFLVSNLLLLNQVPDVDADRRVGRRNLLIDHGLPAAMRVYLLFVFAAVAVVLGGVAAGLLPVAACATLLLIPTGFAIARRVRRCADDIPALIPALSWNVVVAIATPLLLSLVVLIF